MEQWEGRGVLDALLNRGNPEDEHECPECGGWLEVLDRYTARCAGTGYSDGCGYSVEP